MNRAEVQCHLQDSAGVKTSKLQVLGGQFELGALCFRAGLAGCSLHRERQGFSITNTDKKKNEPETVCRSGF